MLIIMALAGKIRILPLAFSLNDFLFSWPFLQLLTTVLVAILFPVTSAAVINYLERKILAWMQDRLGPYHTGPHGSLQLLADMGKLLLKEDIHPASTDKLMFLLAPAAFLAPIIASFAVLPFSPFVGMPGMALATGLVYLVAMSSLDIMGILMAGWGSNNKYSLIGGLRSAAQMISYELPLVLSLVGVIMLTSTLAGLPGYPSTSGIGSISIKEIMGFQVANVWPGQGIPFFDFIFHGFTPWAWFILIQPFMLFIYYICGLAETNRPPFDLPAAESELVAGFLTEYSGIRWALFFLGEYANMTIVGTVVTSLFLGGWSGPGVATLTAPGMALGWQFLGNLLGVLYFVGKVYLVIGVFLWIEATLPRLRSDQLMQFAWLILIPVTLGNILLVALLYLVITGAGLPVTLFLAVTGVLNWGFLIGFVILVRKVVRVSIQRALQPARNALRARMLLQPDTRKRNLARSQGRGR